MLVPGISLSFMIVSVDSSEIWLKTTLRGMTCALRLNYQLVIRFVFHQEGVLVRDLCKNIGYVVYLPLMYH